MKHERMLAVSVAGPGKDSLSCSCGGLNVILEDCSTSVAEQLWEDHVREAAEAYTATLDGFNAVRRKTGVMTMPELVQLVEILREVDGEFQQYEGEYRTPWINDDPNRLHGPGEIRNRLEDLLGVKRGTLAV